MQTEKTTISLTLNKAKAMIGDTEYILQIPAFEKNGTTYLPLRFISEGFNAQIAWNEQTKQAIITNDANGKVLTVSIQKDDISAKSGNTKPEIVKFTLANNNYKLTAPAGYRFLLEKDNTVINAVSAIDNQNITLYTFVPIDEVGHNVTFTNWSTIVTPDVFADTPTPSRKVLIESARRKLTPGYMKKKSDDTSDLVNKRCIEELGENPQLGIQVKLADTDKYAAYIIGTITCKITDNEETSALVAAMTVVRGSVFYYYKYASYNDNTDFSGLLNQVKKDIRKFINDNP